MKEIWKDIKDYEGYYQISNLGRIRSCTRSYAVNGGLYTRKGQILQQSIVQGYKAITLNKERKQRMFKIHRLVASAFLDNPNNYPMINHIDEDKQNNIVTNLEWCTHKQNANHGTARIRLSKTKRTRGQSRKIAMIDSCGNILKTFDAIIDAAKYINARKSDVCAVCNNRQHTVKGFVFKYIDNHENNKRTL